MQKMLSVSSILKDSYWLQRKFAILERNLKSKTKSASLSEGHAISSVFVSIKKCLA